VGSDGMGRPHFCTAQLTTREGGPTPSTASARTALLQESARCRYRNRHGAATGLGMRPYCACGRRAEEVQEESRVQGPHVQKACQDGPGGYFL